MGRKKSKNDFDRFNCGIDCNTCIYCEPTEREQSVNKEAHMCNRYGSWILHHNNNLKEATDWIYPCTHCEKDAFQAYLPRKVEFIEDWGKVKEKQISGGEEEMRGTQCNKDTFFVAGKDEGKIEFHSDVKWICLVHIASWLGVALAVILAVYLTGKAACLWALLIPAFITSSYPSKNQKDDVEKDNQGGQ